MKEKKISRAQLLSRANLPWLFLAAAWIFTVWFQWAFGRTMLDSDMASEMVLANLLNREHSILASNWFYSTELRVFCQQLLFKLSLWIFPHNWHAARTLAQAILTALLVGSSLFFFHAAKFGKSGVMVTAALLCPFSFWYMFHCVFGGFYYVHIIFVLLIAGLVLQLARGTTRGKAIVCYLALAAISTAGGMNGVRVLMCITLPLVVAGVAMLVLRLHYGAARKPLTAMPEVRMLAASLLAAACSAVGYLVNSVVFAGRYHFVDQGKRVWDSFDLSNILTDWGSFFSLFGFPGVDHFDTNISLFSLPGILGVFGVLLCMGVLVCLLRVVGRWQKLTYTQKFMVAVLLSCMLVMCLAFSCTSGSQSSNSTYWLPIVPFGFMILVIELQTEDFRLGETTKRLLVGLFVFSILGSSASCFINFFEHPLRANKEIIPVAEWLADNGYTHGYATFWNANIMTEVTNGALEIWTVENMETLKLHTWLQNYSHLTPPDGRTFFLLKKGESDYSNLPYYVNDDPIVYQDGNFTVLAFDSAYEALDAVSAAGGA